MYREMYNLVVLCCAVQSKEVLLILIIIHPVGVASPLVYPVNLLLL